MRGKRTVTLMETTPQKQKQRRRQQQQTTHEADTRATGKHKRPAQVQQPKRKKQKRQRRTTPERETTNNSTNQARREKEQKPTNNTASDPTADPSSAKHNSKAEKGVMEQLESDDYFEILGLVATATETDVKKAYRRLAVQWHPDKNRTHPKAEEYFKKIGEAYAVLSDPEKRKLYERYGKAGVGGEVADYDEDAFGGESAFHHSPFGFGFGFGGHGGFSVRNARDIFEAFFGGMDPFEDFFNGGGGHSQRRQSRHRSTNDWDLPLGGMGMGFGHPMGGMGANMRGFGGSGPSSLMMDSFFGGNGGGGLFAEFGSFGGGGGFSSSSVSSSSYTDRNGHVVTKKTTTTVDANGRTETLTEEYRNGNLVNSTSSSSVSSSNRLAGVGRMQMRLDTVGTDELKVVDFF
ncbi:Molecular chaperone, partial [Globisporangium splendens]